MHRKINLMMVDDNESWVRGAVDSLNEDYSSKLHADYFSSSHQKQTASYSLGAALVEQMLATKAASGPLPDVFIIDYAMPGMNGVLLIRELKNNSIDIPVLLMTAHDEQMMEESIAALESGAKSYIFKNNTATFYKEVAITVQRVFREDQREKWMRVMLETLAGDRDNINTLETLETFSDFFEKEFLLQISKFRFGDDLDVFVSHPRPGDEGL